jgi:thiol-disulfide isomerase/thioredoxin
MNIKVSFFIVAIAFLILSCSKKPQSATLQFDSNFVGDTVLLLKYRPFRPTDTVVSEVIAADSLQFSFPATEPENLILFVNNKSNSYFWFEPGLVTSFTKSTKGTVQLVEPISVANGRQKMMNDQLFKFYVASNYPDTFMMYFNNFADTMNRSLNAAGNNVFHKKMDMKVRSNLARILGAQYRVNKKIPASFWDSFLPNFFPDNLQWEYLNSSSDAANMLELYWYHFAGEQWNNEYNEKLNKITSPYLKSTYALYALKNSRKAGEDYLNLYNILKPMLSNTDTLSIWSLVQSKTKLAAGTVALNFTLPDAEGKVWTLNDFKGKLVYIDLWATWCTPCIKEGGYLEEVMKQYAENSKIVFVKISFDKRKEQWMSYISNHKTSALNLLVVDAFESELAQFYNVKSIPHFILIDQEGRIIKAFAPRPSSPELTALIDENL